LMNASPMLSCDPPPPPPLRFPPVRACNLAGARGPPLLLWLVERPFAPALVVAFLAMISNLRFV
jgi:hypothetical protein